LASTPNSDSSEKKAIPSDPELLKLAYGKLNLEADNPLHVAKETLDIFCAAYRLTRDDLVGVSDAIFMDGLEDDEQRWRDFVSNYIAENDPKLRREFNFKAGDIWDDDQPRQVREAVNHMFDREGIPASATDFTIVFTRLMVVYIDKFG